MDPPGVPGPHASTAKSAAHWRESSASKARAPVATRVVGRYRESVSARECPVGWCTSFQQTSGSRWSPTPPHSVPGRTSHLGPQRVHLLGRGCQAGGHTDTPHSPDPRGAGGRPASTLLLAGMQTPRAHRHVAQLLRYRRAFWKESCIGGSRRGMAVTRCRRRWRTEADRRTRRDGGTSSSSDCRRRA